MTLDEVTRVVWALLSATLAGDVEGVGTLLDDLSPGDVRRVLACTVAALAGALSTGAATEDDLQQVLGELLLSIARSEP